MNMIRDSQFVIFIMIYTAQYKWFEIWDTFTESAAIFHKRFSQEDNGKNLSYINYPDIVSLAFYGICLILTICFDNIHQSLLIQVYLESIQNIVCYDNKKWHLMGNTLFSAKIHVIYMKK